MRQGFKLTRSSAYVIATTLLVILLLACVLPNLKSAEHYVDGDNLSNTDINITIVRAYSNALKRFPTSQEIKDTKAWISSTFSQRDANDKEALKQRVIKRLSDGKKPDAKSDDAKSDDAKSDEAKSDEAKSDDAKSHDANVKVDAEAETRQTSSSSPAPANSLASRETFASADGSDTITIGLSTKNVQNMRDKVSFVLTNLEDAHDAMKVVSKNEDDVVPVPVSRDDIARLRNQLDKLSSQLMRLESDATQKV